MKAPDFRSFLQAELVRRTKANPRYSLRAFAKLLDVQSGFLSKILLGQRRVTVTTVRRFGAKLGMPLRQIEEYAALCQKGEAHAVLDFKQMAFEHFQVISDWYHFAILELSLIDGFEPNAQWIARTLGISNAEVKAAIDRLVRLNYLRIGPKGEWILSEAHSTTLGTEETASALRRVQKQFLEKSIQALEEIPISRRDQTGMTMAVDASRLPEAKEKIKKFRRDLCAFLEGGSKKNAVYQLSVSLFPLTKERES